MIAGVLYQDFPLRLAAPILCGICEMDAGVEVSLSGHFVL